jgi:hypothetical protein
MLWKIFLMHLLIFLCDVEKSIRLANHIYISSNSSDFHKPVANKETVNSILCHVIPLKCGNFPTLSREMMLSISPGPHNTPVFIFRQQSRSIVKNHQPANRLWQWATTSHGRRVAGIHSP